MNISMDNQMKLPLQADWKAKVTEKAKVYPAGIKDRQCIDKVFDKLHTQGCLEQTKFSTPFSFSIFVKQKTNQDDKLKSQPVVDIQSLNNVLISDVYLFLAQSKIIASLQSCINISVFNVASFFYQWQVYPDYCHMFTIVTHCG